MKPERQSKTRKNFEIRAREVRLIGAAGEQLGIVPGREALQRAEELGMDLVEISPNTNPPVCKIMDYGKHLYQISKKQAEAKKKQKHSQVKQIRVRPTIDIGDYQVKLRNLIRFLEEGDKVEINLRFRGREMEHKEIGMSVLQRIKKDTEEYADVEREPSFMGRQMLMILMPKKK